MNRISFLDEQDFYNKTKYYDEGFESKLYIYSYDDKEILIKKYYDFDRLDIDKINKVSNLNTEGIIKPVDLVTIDNQVNGFSMDFKRYFYPISVLKEVLTYQQKCEIIIKIKNILRSLNDENCLYGDLSLKNVITDGKEVYLTDPLNIKIDEYSFDEITHTMHNYYMRNNTFTGIDNYMLNLLTVYLFNNINYDDIIDTISLTLTKFFNKENYDNIVGITDSMDNMNLAYDIFLSSNICDNLLIDNMVGLNNISLNESKSY